MSSERRMSHIVVVGSGIAGLTAALRLAGRHEVTVVTKRRLGQSNTALAQGGIAGVLSADDSVESHIADTLAAGGGLSDDDAVRVLCTEGPERILELAAAGVAFDRDESGHWARGLEGAHSIPRILHAGGDATGRAIVEALTNALRAQVAAGRVTLLEHTMLLDLATSPAGSIGDGAVGDGAVGGGAAGDGEVTGVELLRDTTREFLAADAVVLATGGAGQLYAHTTNPESATGDGLAAAIRAGAAVSDMEFYQFHPTALAGSGFLISEAVRGAGALLLDDRGDRFMTDVDRRGELAPRDVVALAIHRRMTAQDGRPCYLDARSVPEVASHFPSIAHGLATHGFDLATDLIPVTPAAHYFMGGISTDLDGRTSIARLFAVGEVACTGVHGANRLASNSLLEGVVFGARAAAAIDTGIDKTDEAGTASDAASNAATDEDLASAEWPKASPVGEALVGTDSRAGSAVSRDELRALAWAHLGVERNDQGLRSLLHHLGERQPTVPGTRTLPNDSIGLTPQTLSERVETANLALIARSIASHALARRESRGAHTRSDVPAPTTPLFQEAASC
ncbi:MAG: L-aspartate oxidase [Tomitella sp.]|nr:L-aspartate oxidase [Tomitella sp.]